jgi:hypothetical protein
MNERIKLPDQEWLGYDPEKGDIHGYTFEQMRDFTELIVRECGEIAYKTYWNNPLEVRGVHFKEAMYKQFGIRYE